MSFVYLDIQRSFCEYLDSNLATQSGEVIRYEFPNQELGSHTYAVSFPSIAIPYYYGGRNLGGTAKGREITTVAQVDVFRLPTVGEPDVAGALQMMSRVTDLFKGTHFIPYKSYGANPTVSTVGTQVSTIRVDEEEAVREAFDENPNLRRYLTRLKLMATEIF